MAALWKPRVGRAGLIVTGVGAGLLITAAAPRGQAPANPRSAASRTADQRVEFNRDIRPILSDKCYTCHGPDKERRRSKVRFDIESEAKQDLGGRFAIVPGDAAKSEMIRRITASEPARLMPPPSSGRTLTSSEIQLIQR